MGRSAVTRALAVGAPGVRRVRRPADASGPTFDLTYVRTGPRTSVPAVVIPGGPGLGSVVPYRALRRRAARLGLDLIMVEHRGVGLSRTDLHGADLPGSAMRISAVVDDIAAVLDREGVRSAVVVGSSYGSYVASGFAARFPGRVEGLLLDSALQSAEVVEEERRAVRALFWEADTPVAQQVRALYASGEDDRRLLGVLRAAYELDGVDVVDPLLRRRGDRGPALAWRLLEAYADRSQSMANVPGVYEFDLVGAIGFRELGYGATPDGLPLDPALTYAPIAHRFPPFVGEPFDLAREAPGFRWPVVLLSGSRDLRTPPAIAERVAALAPFSTLVGIENGHSALDTHPEALLRALTLLVAGRHRELPQQAAELNRLPRRGIAARSPALLRLLLQ